MITGVVSWNGVISDQFKLCNGVKEGSVISPLLFSMYINPLIQDLNRSKLSCCMGGICCNTFAYADDIVVLSANCDVLRKIVRVCEQHETLFILSFNPHKGVLIIFSDFMDSVYIKTYGRTIQSYIYLISSRGCLVNLEPVIGDMKVRTNVITHQFYSTSWQSKVLLFNGQCMSLYGCQLWNLYDLIVECGVAGVLL